MQQDLKITVSHKYLSFSFLFNATAKGTLRGMIWGSTSSEELENTHNVKYNTSFDEPPLNCSILPCTGPQKRDRSV